MITNLKKLIWLNIAFIVSVLCYGLFVPPVDESWFVILIAANSVSTVMAVMKNNNQYITELLIGSNGYLLVCCVISTIANVIAIFLVTLEAVNTLDFVMTLFVSAVSIINILFLKQQWDRLNLA